MPAARAEEKGESSTAAYKALTANPNGTPVYELPW
jgi:replication factor C subunit 2/4